MNTGCYGCGSRIETRVVWDAYCEKCSEESKSTEQLHRVKERVPEPSKRMNELTLNEPVEYGTSNDSGMGQLGGAHVAITHVFLISLQPVLVTF